MKEGGSEMKKEYSKPEVYFDSFELSQSIAAGCRYISNQEAEVCPVDIDAPFTLYSTTGICGMTPSGPYDRICYDVPSADSMIFTS